MVDPVPLDEAVAAFASRVLDELLAQVADEDAVRRTLQGLGLEGDDLDSLVQYVADHADDVATLVEGVPPLIDELSRATPSLAMLVREVPDLFGAVASLSQGEVPDVELPALPDAGSAMDALLALAIERTLQARAPATWSVAKGMQLVGPEVPFADVVTQLLQSPTGFVWQRFQHLRRHLDVTITGILTGPRTVSVVTVPVSPADHVDAAVQAAIPDADVVLQRVILRLAADTYGEPHAFTFEALGHDPGNGDAPGFAAVTLTTRLDGPVTLAPGVTVDLAESDDLLGVAMIGWGELVPVRPGPPRLRLGSAFSSGFRFGDPDGLRLQLSGPVLDPRIDADGWGLRAGLETFELTIPQDVLGDLVALLLPRDGVRLRGKLIVTADRTGLHAEGGIGLKTTWPDTLRLPGLLVRGLTTEITTTTQGVPGLTLAAAGTVTVDLGVLTATVEGLGLDLLLELRTDGTGNLGLLELGEPALHPPTGIGVSLDAAIVKGGGFLRIEPTGISGALELALRLGSVELAIRAVGVIESVDGQLSFVVVMSVEFTPAIELFLGLTLNAVGGVLGINRSLDPEALRATVRAGRMSDVMFPHDLATRAVEVIAGVKQVFPARVGQFVVGPMLKLGWGRPVSFITVSVGVVFTFPDPVVIAVIGSLRIALPEPELPIIDIRADFSGIIDASTGEVSFDASLTNSRIATFDVTGDLALRAGPSGFVFTAGGFYPGFPVPAGLASVRRLAISIAPSPILAIRADAYFAVTASTVQFGGGLSVVAELGPIGAHGQLQLDVLIRTSPKLAFTATMNGHFRLSFEGEDILGADLDVLLEGPGRWHARAHAEISFLFFSVSGSLELSWGDETGEPPPVVLVAKEVHGALEQPSVWTHVLPAQESGLVTLREGAGGLHPLGRLRLTQTIAPLDVGLARFGAAVVADAGPVHVDVTTDLAEAEAADELFAAAQFFDLTDDEKISKPAFVPMKAGHTLSATGWDLGHPVAAEIGYEESSGEPRPPAGSRRFGGLDESFLGLLVLGAAGRGHGQRTVVADPRPRIEVHPAAYAVADAATGLVRDGAPAGVEQIFTTSTRVSADTVVLADYERAGMVG